MIFTDVRELAKEVASRFTMPGIIGIDGWTGVGKTTLGRALASSTGGSAFDIDTALIHDQKSFVTALRLDKIRESLAEPTALLFVSGICLRQVFDAVKCEAVAHIYIKLMATWGWSDEDELSGSVPEIPGASGEMPRQEMRAYHERWQPHLRADYEFHRPD